MNVQKWIWEKLKFLNKIKTPLESSRGVYLLVTNFFQKQIVNEIYGNKCFKLCFKNISQTLTSMKYKR